MQKNFIVSLLATMKLGGFDLYQNYKALHILGTVLKVISDKLISWILKPSQRLSCDYHYVGIIYYIRISDEQNKKYMLDKVHSICLIM